MTESTETERMGVVSGIALQWEQCFSFFKKTRVVRDRGWLYNTMNVLNTAKMDTTVIKIGDFSAED